MLGKLIGKALGELVVAPVTAVGELIDAGTTAIDQAGKALDRAAKKIEGEDDRR